MSPYDDPAVSAGEIADYLDQLRLESSPSPATATATPSDSVAPKTGGTYQTLCASASA